MVTNKPLRLILLGPPGSGKGTLSKHIVANLGLTHLSSGDMFRKNDSPEGLEAKRLMAEGKYVPDDITNRLVSQAILKIDNPKGFILDGYPRTTTQADFLRTVCQIDVAVLLNIDEKILISRLSGRRICPHCGAIYNVYHKATAKDGICDNCGTALVRRKDDDPQTARKRIEIYDQQTKPLVNYYKAMGILVPIDSSGDEEAVFEEFKKQVIDRA